MEKIGSIEKMGDNLKAPKDLEKEVFNTLDSMKLLADIIDLFTVKYVKSEAEILGINMNPPPLIERNEKDSQNNNDQT